MGEEPTPRKDLVSEGKQQTPAANVKKSPDLKLVRIQIVNVPRGFATVRESDAPMLSMFRWHYENGLLMAELQDLYGLRVSMGYMLSHPNIVVGSHSCN
jgi:hypothetical protein